MIVVIRREVVTLVMVVKVHEVQKLGKVRVEQFAYHGQRMRRLLCLSAI